MTAKRSFAFFSKAGSFGIRKQLSFTPQLKGSLRSQLAILSARRAQPECEPLGEHRKTGLTEGAAGSGLTIQNPASMYYLAHLQVSSKASFLED